MIVIIRCSFGHFVYSSFQSPLFFHFSPNFCGVVYAFLLVKEKQSVIIWLYQVTTWSFKSLALRTQHINRYKSSKVRMAWTTCSPLLTPTSFAFLCHLTLILWQKDDPVRLSSARQVSNQTHFLCHLYMYRVDFVLLWIIDLNAFILGVLA